MSRRRRPLAEGESAVFGLVAPGPVGGERPRSIAVTPVMDPAAAIAGSHAGEPIEAPSPNPARVLAARRFPEAAARPGLLRRALAGDDARFLASERTDSPQLPGRVRPAPGGDGHRAP